MQNVGPILSHPLLAPLAPLAEPDISGPAFDSVVGPAIDAAPALTAPPLPTTQQPAPPDTVATPVDLADDEGDTAAEPVPAETGAELGVETIAEPETAVVDAVSSLFWPQLATPPLIQITLPPPSVPKTDPAITAPSDATPQTVATAPMPQALAAQATPDPAARATPPLPDAAKPVAQDRSPPAPVPPENAHQATATSRPAAAPVPDPTALPQTAARPWQDRGATPAPMPIPMGMTVHPLARQQATPPIVLAATGDLPDAVLPADVVQDAPGTGVLRDPDAPPAPRGPTGDAAMPPPAATRDPVFAADAVPIDPTTGLPQDPLPQMPQPGLAATSAGTVAPGAAIPLAAVPQVVAAALRDDPARAVELRLDPPELGSVRFQLDQRATDLVVTIIAERPETLDLMRRHSEQLLADLRQAGFVGASLNFAGGQGGQAQQGFAQNGFGQDTSGQGTGQNPAQNAPAPAAGQSAFSPPQPARTATGGLNLRL